MQISIEGMRETLRDLSKGAPSWHRDAIIESLIEWVESLESTVVSLQEQIDVPDWKERR